MLRILPSGLFILLALLSAVMSAHATDTPASGSIRVDYLRSSQSLSFEQARLSDQWQTTEDRELTFGFDPSWYWVRIPLAQLPLASSPGNWIAEAGYPLIDYLSFYLVQDNRILDQMDSGNNLPFAERRIRVPAFAFRFAADSGADYLYLSAHTQSSVQLPLTILPEADYWQRLVRPFAADAAFHAILLSMLTYNLLIFLLTRDRLFLLYTASIGSIALMMASLHGWTYAFLWPDSPQLNDRMVLLTIASAEIFTALFSMRFLRLARLHPGMNRAFIVQVILAAVLGVCSLFTEYATMVRLLVGLAVIMTFMALVMGILLFRETRSRDVMLFFTALSFLVVGLALYALLNFGLMPANLLIMHSAELGHVSQVILLALSLADRHNRERTARIAAQDIIISMQRETNALLDLKVRERTADLEQANRRLQEESTTDALTQVRNRRYFDQRFFTLFQEAFRQRSPLALLLVDIDHFKQFNDRWGHQTGDMVLQKVAAAMQQVVRRPMDTVYRYGGEEFAVLLPQTDEEGALVVAEQLRKRIATLRLSHQDQDLGVTISIGLTAAVPAHREDQQDLYEAADRALYRAKENGRNQVCAFPLNTSA